jgi:hypothetical protein
MLISSPTPDLYYEIVCERCRTHNVLPREILLHILGDPDGHTTQYPAIAYVCHECKHIHLLQKDAMSGIETVACSDPLETVPYAVLGCAEATCNMPVPLYAQWSYGTTEVDRQADIEKWIWDDLRCSLGHPILKWHEQALEDEDIEEEPF